jgi:hypothetical protein
MSDDLSDEAFREWCNYDSTIRVSAAMNAWRECRRRAEAIIEIERNFNLTLKEIVKDAEARREKSEAMIEERERNAYKAGWEAVSTFAGDQGPRDPLIDPEMAREQALKAYQKLSKKGIDKPCWKCGATREIK